MKKLIGVKNNCRNKRTWRKNCNLCKKLIVVINLFGVKTVINWCKIFGIKYQIFGVKVLR